VGDDRRGRRLFRVTKRLHNRLHGYIGDGGPLGDGEREVYEHRAGENAELLAERLGPPDVVLLHDPQTAGMIPRLRELGVPIIWRAHIGLDLPNDLAREAWQFLIGYVELADAYVFSRPAYTLEGLDRSKLTVIAPSIDAFAPKKGSPDVSVGQVSRRFIVAAVGRGRRG
jgi:trehalose synthase